MTDPLIKKVLHIDYKKFRNEITKDKCLSKKAYFTSHFEINKQKSSDIWKGIRSLVNIKSLKFSTFKLLDNNHNLISEPQKISIIFNDHFASTGSAKEQFKDYLNKKIINGRLHLDPSNSFFLTPTVHPEIIDALM